MSGEKIPTLFLFSYFDSMQSVLNYCHRQTIEKGSTMITMKDDFGNIATVEKMRTKPYNSATKMVDAYCVSLFDETGFMYFRSVYETLTSALAKIKKFSCGTFRKYNIGFSKRNKQEQIDYFNWLSNEMMKEAQRYELDKHMTNANIHYAKAEAYEIAAFELAHNMI